MIPFLVIAFQARLSVHRLARTYEAQSWVTEDDAIVGVPSSQHCARNLRWNAADRGARPDPARWRISHPGLSVIFVDVLDLHAAKPVRQIVVLRTSDGVRELVEAEFPQPWNETRQLLASEGPEHHFRCAVRPCTGRYHQDQSREVGMIDQLDRAVGREIVAYLAAGTPAQFFFSKPATTKSAIDAARRLLGFYRAWRISAK